MKRTVLITTLFFLSMMGFSQKILVVENVNSLRNIKYYQGDAIILKEDNIQDKIFDEIVDMTDSSIILNNLGEVSLENILIIYRDNWFIQTLRGLSLLGGVAYFSLDSFNRLINNDSPVILAETAIISGGLVAFSFALIPFKYRKLDVQRKWALRTIDLNSF